MAVMQYTHSINTNSRQTDDGECQYYGSARFLNGCNMIHVCGTVLRQGMPFDATVSQARCLDPSTPTPGDLHELASTGIAIHDGLKTVGDSEDGAVTECFGDGLLDEGIGLHIHRRSHLIHQKQFALAKKSPCKAHKLALPHGEILPALDDRDVEFVVGLLKHVPQVRLLKRAPDRLVRVGGVRVKIGANSSTEENRILRDDADAAWSRHTEPPGDDQRSRQ
eukprot:gene11155-biopygen397